MLLAAGAIAIIVLITVLAVLMVEEDRMRKSLIPKGTLTAYWDGKERRYALRVGTSLLVKYYIENKPSIALNGHIKNISAGGMNLTITEKLAKETLLLLEFDLPESKNSIGAEGKVVWSEGKIGEKDSFGRRVFQTGIRFISLKDEDKKRLMAYVGERTDEREKKA